MDGQSQALGVQADRNGFTVPDAGVSWSALIADSGAGVLVSDQTGRFMYCNPAAAEFFGTGTAGVVGKTLADFLPEDAASERLKLIARCAETGRAISVDGMLRGHWARCTHRAVRTPGATMVVTVISLDACSAHTTAVTDAEIVPALHSDGGPLGSLTSREIDVLRLIGHGLSTAEIAAELHRSVKTIEWHRVSLGSKLKQSNRVGLARVAIRSGLSNLDPACDRGAAGS